MVLTRNFLVIAFLTIASYAAVTNVQMGDVTAQQGIVSFSVPDPTQCTVTAYSDVALTLKMDDTNNAVFANSENCSRTFNIVDGTHVTAVLGRRTSDLASDGKLHSRSLAVASSYFVRITDTLNSVSSTISFTTRNIPWGDTHPEGPGFNASGWSNYAYPDLDWSDAGINKWYVDPTSGLQFRRTPRALLGSGGPDGNSPLAKVKFPGAFDVTKEQTGTAKWTNVSNAMNQTTAGPFATYSGTTRDSLFLPFDRWTQQTPYNVWFTIEDIQSHFYGSAPGCTGEDCKITVCLAAKYNPVTDICTSPELDVTLPASPVQTDFPTNANYPVYQFGGWNVGRFLRSEEIGVWGSLRSNYESGLPAEIDIISSVAQTSIKQDGDTLLPDWAAVGMKFQVASNPNQWYTIGTLNTAQTWGVKETGVTRGGQRTISSCTRTSGVATCTTTVPHNYQIGDWITNFYAGPFDGWGQITAVTGTTYTYANSGPDGTGTGGFVRESWLLGNVGIRIRKKTTTNNLINIAADYSFVQVDQPRITSNSEHPWCSNLDFPLSVAADGTTAIPTKRARLCQLGEYSGNTQLLIVADDGEIRYISPMQGTGVTIPFGTFSTTDAFSMWGVGADTTLPQYQSLYKATYVPGACNFRAWTGNNYRQVTAPADCMVYTNVTPGSLNLTVTQQLAANIQSNAVWDPTWTDKHCDPQAPPTGVGANCFSFTAIAGDYAWFSAGGQDGVIWQADFDLNTGLFKKVIDSFSNSLQNWRWSGQHSGGGTVGNWIEFDSKTLYGGGKPYLTGPWILPPGAISQKSIDGVTYSNDTSLITPIPYGWTCGMNDAGVSGDQCVWLHLTTDEVCNVNSDATYSTETTRWPCSWHPGWTKGILRIQVGDFFGDYNPGAGGSGIDGKGEKMRVLTKVTDGGTGYYVMAQRHAACDNPTGDLNGTPPAVLYFRAVDGQSTWLNGWNLYMSFPYGCDGGIAWANSTTALADSVMPPFVSQGIQHGSGGIGPNGIDSVAGGTGIYVTAPFAQLPGTSAHVTQNYTNVPWNGVLNGDSTSVMEIYTQINNTNAPTQLMRSLSFDAHHMNPEGGAYPEKGGIYLYAQTYTPVPNTTNVFKLDPGQMQGVAADQKMWRPVTTATNHSWLDISSAATGDLITDATAWASCYAYRNGECRLDSIAGDYYVWAKNAWMEKGGCVISNLKTYSPCTYAPWPQSGWITESSTQQNDVRGTHIRRLTMGLNGPMSWYHFSTPHMTPDHKFMFVRSSYINGVSDRPLLYKLPPPPSDDSIDRSHYIPIAVTLAASPDLTRVKFGYAENGPATSLFCTSRQEACVVNGGAPPFSYETSDSAPGVDCSAACSFNIPALSGRILYYRVERRKGSAWVAGSLQVRAVQ